MHKPKLYVLYVFIVICCMGCKKQQSMNEKTSENLYLNESAPSKFNADMLEWLKNTTSIPVYLPSSWEPILQIENSKNYYFAAFGDKESYQIDVYKTQEEVKFNDNNDLLEKNGPISEADYIGSISGGLYEFDDSSFDIPKDLKSFELNSEITAYQMNETEVVWRQNGWLIHYIGVPINQDIQDMFEALSSVWTINRTSIHKTGNIEIIEGNRVTINYDWENDGYKYGYKVNGIDFEEAVKIISSFTYIDTKQ